MFKLKIGFFLCSIILVLNGCVIIDAENSCRARGGFWSEYDVIGQKIWPGRCVGSVISHEDQCDQIRDSYQTLPSYCDEKPATADKPKAPKTSLADKPKTPKTSVISKLDVAAFPKSATQPTEGERFLMDTVSPFLCKVVKGERPAEKLKSMGSFAEDFITSTYKNFNYNAGVFKGSLNQFYDPTGKLVEQSGVSLKTEYWPFTTDELTSWMFNRGYKVLMQEKDKEGRQAIRGVAVYDDSKGGSYTDLTSYDIVLSWWYNDSAVKTTAKNSQRYIYFSWRQNSLPGNFLCNK